MNINYKDLVFDKSLVKILTTTFINKYYIVPFSIVDNKIIFITSNNTKLSTLLKCNNITNKESIIIKVDNTFYKNGYDLYMISLNSQTAINNLDSSTLTLHEEETITYEAEVVDAPIVKLVDSYIQEAIKLNVSDVHFIPTNTEILVKFRIDGNLILHSNISIMRMNEISSRLKVLSNLDITKRLTPQDGKFSYTFQDKRLDIRTSFMPTLSGEMITLRILDLTNKILEYKTLGFTKKQLKSIDNLIHESSGLILCCGPTGSGKSTTLHSFLIENKKEDKNLITIEDPVEYTIDGVNQVQVNNETGLTFNAALRNIFRQDSNVLMIGEIRDEETASIAMRMSLTGHLVYSTLHTSTSFGVISRLLDMNIEKYVIHDSLKGIISQRLIRLLCDKCKKEYTATADDLKYLRIKDSVTLYHASGCKYCNFTGYKERKAIYEVIEFTEEYKNVFNSSNDVESLENIFIKSKCESMFDIARDLILEGKTSIDEIKNKI